MRPDKYNNINEMPDIMYINGVLIEGKKLPVAFADRFSNKILNFKSKLLQLTHLWIMEKGK